MSLTYKWQFRLIKVMDGLVLLLIVTTICFAMVTVISFINEQRIRQDLLPFVEYVLIWTNGLTGVLSSFSTIVIVVYLVVRRKHSSGCFTKSENRNYLLLYSNYPLAAICMGFYLYLLIGRHCPWTVQFTEYVLFVFIPLTLAFISLTANETPIPDERVLYTVYAAAGYFTFGAFLSLAVRWINVQLIGFYFQNSTITNCAVIMYRSGGEYVFELINVLFLTSAAVQLCVMAVNVSNDILIRLYELMHLDNNYTARQMEIKRLTLSEQVFNIKSMLKNHWVAAGISMTVSGMAVITCLVFIINHFIHVPALDAAENAVVIYGLFIVSIACAAITTFCWLKMDSWKPVGSISAGMDKVINSVGSVYELIIWTTSLIIHFSESLYNYEQAYYHKASPVMVAITGCAQIIQTYSQFVIATEILHRKMEIRLTFGRISSADPEKPVQKVENQWDNLTVPCFFLCTINILQFLLCPFIAYTPLLYITTIPVRMFYRLHAFTFFLNVFICAANKSGNLILHDL